MDSITINHRKIHRSELLEFARDWSGDPAIPHFLQSWFDPEDGFQAYTSGSTGNPHKITLLKKYAAASARATIRYFDLKPGHTALLSMPAEYIAGRMMLVRVIVGNLNLVPIPPSSCPNIPHRSIDLAAFTPHQFQNIIESPGNQKLPNIRNVLLGGSPVPQELVNKLKDYPGRIYETFGMTETYSHVALKRLHPEEETFFQAVQPAHFSTKDGRLVVRAPHLGIDDIHTRDIVELDGTSRFRWLGRADFVINSGGIKIHPEVIENKLAEFIHSPYFITGQPDPMYGEKVILVIQKDKNGPEEDELRSQMDKILTKYEKPKSILWVDTMIYTSTGKINRKETKDLFHI